MPLAVGGQTRDGRGRFAVRADTDRLTRLIRLIPERTRTAVDDVAHAIRDDARSRAPRDTGSLIASLYVGNGEESDYAQCAAAARSLNHDAVIEQEVRPEFVLSLFGSGNSGFGAVIGSAVQHAIFQEFGTVHMGPQSFLNPAVEAHREEFINAMKQVPNT